MKRSVEISNWSSVLISIVVFKHPPGCLGQTLKVCHLPFCDIGKLWTTSAHMYGQDINWLGKKRLFLFVFLFVFL